MTDKTDGALDLALKYAREHDDDSLQGCLERIKKVEIYHNADVLDPDKIIDTNIFIDFSPLSFVFVRVDLVSQKFRSNGGIIFHGKHDNGGDGSAPTFSVNLIPCSGWAIHT